MLSEETRAVIRPTEARVRELSPLKLSRTTLHGDKWLFWGRRG
jgi:hypothetical protein